MKVSHQLIVAAFCAAFAAPVAAQEAPAGQAGEPEAILVTGQRDDRPVELGPLGATAVKDVPFSISVYGADDADRIQARELGELLRLEPGITSSVNAGSYANNVELRGFAVASLFLGLPNEATDFTYRRDSLFNVERVTVLRGVSSLLYGGAAFVPVGGAVDVTPKQPLPASYSAARLGVAEGLNGLAAIDLSRRIAGDRLGVRVNLGTQQGETAIDRQEIDNRTAAVAVDARLTADLHLTAGAEYARNFIYGYRDTVAVAPGAAVPDAPDGRRNLSQRWTRYLAESGTGWAKLDWRPADGWRIGVTGLIGGGQRDYVSTFATIDGPNGAATVYPGSYGIDQENASIQAKAEGQIDLGRLRLKPTLAVNWARENWFFRTNFDSTGVGIGPFASNIYAPAVLPEPTITGLVKPDLPTFYDLGYGVAGSLRAELGALTLIGGVRRAWLKGETFVNEPVRAQSASYDQAKTTPLVAATLALTPALSVYASYAEGLEIGGTAPIGTINANQRLPARATRQVELGGKWQVDAGLLVTLALFDTERPLEFIDFAEGAGGEYVQRGRQRHRGIEASVAGTIRPGTFVSGGLILLDPVQRVTADAATEGRRPPGVPDYRATLTGEQAIGGGLSLVGTAERQGRVFLDGANLQHVPAWTRVDLGAAYRFRLGRQATVLRATIDNVLGENYWAGAQFGALTYGAPAHTWRVSMESAF